MSDCCALYWAIRLDVFSYMGGTFSLGFSSIPETLLTARLRKAGSGAVLQTTRPSPVKNEPLRVAEIDHSAFVNHFWLDKHGRVPYEPLEKLKLVRLLVALTTAVGPARLAIEKYIVAISCTTRGAGARPQYDLLLAGYACLRGRGIADITWRYAKGWIQARYREIHKPQVDRRCGWTRASRLHPGKFLPG